MWRSILARPALSAVLAGERVFRDAALHLERPHSGDDDSRGGPETRLPALDVEELLGAEICAEAGFRHGVVAKLECGLCGDDGIATVRDVRERAAMHENGRALQGLNQIGLQRVSEQRRHRARGLEVSGRHG